MSDLKTLKIRINSVKKTQKITKAMKMVAASKLRRAREAAENARSYADKMQEILDSQTSSSDNNIQERSLLFGVNDPKTYLYIVVTSDRGLCGGLNSHIVKHVIAQKEQLEKEGKKVKIYNIGKKGYEQFKNFCADGIIANDPGFSNRKVDYNIAKEVASDIEKRFLAEEFDACQIVYPKFKSAISQVTEDFPLISSKNDKGDSDDFDKIDYEYEPEKSELLSELVVKNINIQIYQAFLEVFASEQGARMTAMDSAVNNCEDMIKNLSLLYNRTRQAKITTELIEIIAATQSM